jgi:hypothetical protein
MGTHRHRRAAEADDRGVGRPCVGHIPRVSVDDRFAAALAAENGRDAADGPDEHLLPVRLARAAARLLGAGGVGLSLLTNAGERTPLAASSAEAGTAERLQFTVGSGPCMQAQKTGQPLFVVEDDIHRRWPAFADLLLTRTSFRGIVSLPLRSPMVGLGAMNLFFRDPADLRTLDVFDAVAVGELITIALGDTAMLSTWSEVTGPDWLRSPPALRRAAVWDAVGRTSLALDVDAPEALSLLRAFAYAGGRSVDAVAADLLSGRLRPVDVGGQPAG